jgi:hypothetical protein
MTQRDGSYRVRIERLPSRWWRAEVKGPRGLLEVTISARTALDALDFAKARIEEEESPR